MNKWRYWTGNRRKQFKNSPGDERWPLRCWSAIFFIGGVFFFSLFPATRSRLIDPKNFNSAQRVFRRCVCLPLEFRRRCTGNKQQRAAAAREIYCGAAAAAWCRVADGRATPSRRFPLVAVDRRATRPSGRTVGGGRGGGWRRRLRCARTGRKKTASPAFSLDARKLVCTSSVVRTVRRVAVARVSNRVV